MPRCQIVDPDTSERQRERICACTLRQEPLHAFTEALGVEGERLPTVPAVIRSSSRAGHERRSSTEAEVCEEMERMVYAVLQCAVPAPSPAESRYLSRIFRGNAVV